MVSGRILLVVITAGWSVGCTQVHQLGQVDDGADDAVTSMSSDDSSGSGTDTTGSDSETGSGSSSDSSSESGEGETSVATTDEGGSEDTTAETGGEIPEPCDVVDLGGDEGLTIDIVLMTQWDAGACHEFHVTNETRDDVIWSRELRFGGAVDNYWNAEGEELNSTDWRFEGQASAGNVVVLSGSTVSFGSCMACVP